MEHYNFCRPHKTLSKPYRTTPAMSAGLADQPHDIHWLVSLVEAYTPKPGPRGPYKPRVKNGVAGLYESYSPECLR